MVTSSINGELSMAIEVKTVFVCSCLNVELFGNLLSHFFFWCTFHFGPLHTRFLAYALLSCHLNIPLSLYN